MLIPLIPMKNICAVPLLRTQAFRLQPIKLGTDLIAQLMAVATKLEGLAGRLQELVKKNNKNKHYREIILEAIVFSDTFKPNV